MAPENEELQDIKSAAQSALSHWMAYLEPICRSLAAEQDGQAEAKSLPSRAVCLLNDAGYLEGLRLKGLGVLCQDLLGFIQELALSFEVEVDFEGAFKLPFVGGTFSLQCKSMNPWRVEAWRIFHGGLLSAYALHPLHLIWEEPHNPLEARMSIGEGDSQEAPGKAIPSELSHSAQNLLTGITNYAALILKEPAGDPALTEKVTLIQEAARKLTQKLMSSR